MKLQVLSSSQNFSWSSEIVPRCGQNPHAVPLCPWSWVGVWPMGPSPPSFCILRTFTFFSQIILIYLESAKICGIWSRWARGAGIRHHYHSNIWLWPTCGRHLIRCLQCLCLWMCFHSGNSPHVPQSLVLLDYCFFLNPKFDLFFFLFLDVFIQVEMAVSGQKAEDKPSKIQEHPACWILGNDAQRCPAQYNYACWTSLKLLLLICNPQGYSVSRAIRPKRERICSLTSWLKLFLLPVTILWQLLLL